MLLLIMYSSTEYHHVCTICAMFVYSYHSCRLVTHILFTVDT